AVFDTVRRGDVLIAQVEGSQYTPYHITITLDEAGVLEAECTCPYDWGGVCKHIVAVLLTYIHEAEVFAQRPEPADLLANLKRDDLLGLLTRLLERNPSLLDWVEGELQARQATAEEPRQRRTLLDPAPFRRQVQYILGSVDYLDPSEAYWATSGVVRQLDGVRDQALEFLHNGDAESALTIMLVLVEEVAESYEMFYDEGELADFIDSLSAPIAEAILSADLDSAERQELANQLTGWRNYLDDYGAGEVLDVAVAAAVHGWEAEPMVEEEDELWEEDAWEIYDDWRFVDLTDVKLNILEWEGRLDEFLDLARQAGRHLRYALKLVDLGRIHEATSHALVTLGRPEESLTLAQRLREEGAIEEALAIGEQGLSLPGHLHTLGTWFADVAAGLGRRDLALTARLAAFQSIPSLADYETIRDLAGEEWPALRPQLMETLRRSAYTDALVDVLLSEGQVDEAIQVAEEHEWNYRLLEKAVDAAIETHPDWVIRVSCRQAESLIDRVQSKYYDVAVRWLAKAKAGYLTHGRGDEWTAYLADLRTRHSRKRALLSRLQGL
ncbi:MAG: SWIM zinc finger domain-containing protein, partial [Anaerolineae bacterium]